MKNKLKMMQKEFAIRRKTFLSKTQEFPSPVLILISTVVAAATQNTIILIHKFHNIWLRVMASLTISPQNFILFVAIVHFM